MNTRKTVRRSSRLVLAVTGGLVVTMSLATSASARTPVDPSTLNPPPPAAFNPVCYRDGSHISCDVAFSDPATVAAPSGVVCNGTELLYSYSRSVVGKRTYSGDGNLLRRHFRESLAGTITDPTTGQFALFTQDDTVIQDLAVPGDQNTGTERDSGVQRYWLPGGGTILTDAGHTVIDVATGNTITESAHHPIDAYFSGDTAALAPLCAALA